MDEKQYAGQLLTVSEVAEILRVDVATVRRWVSDGSLKALPLPKRANAKRQLIRIKGEHIDRILSDEEKHV